jgi:hypothetical protein
MGNADVLGRDGVCAKGQGANPISEIVQEPYEEWLNETVAQ